MRIQERPSPNWNVRPHGTIIDTLVLHADASPSVSQSLSWMLRRQANPKDRVSYHDIIGRLGDIYHLVDHRARAWHAGQSRYRDRGDCNDYSIGVCFSNRNDGQESYRPDQLEAGVELCVSIMRAWPAITMDRVTTHALVAVPCGRKTDPKGFPLADFLYEVRSRLDAQ